MDEKEYTPKEISLLTGIDEKKVRHHLRSTLPRFDSEKNMRWKLNRSEFMKQLDYWNSQ